MQCYPGSDDGPVTNDDFVEPVGTYVGGYLLLNTADGLSKLTRLPSPRARSPSTASGSRSRAPI